MEKMLYVLLISLTLFSVLGYAQNAGKKGNGENIPQVDTLPFEDVSEFERESLIFMHEEEKLARDVYLALFKKWEMQIFSNISASEQRHMDAIYALLKKYEISTVTSEEQGVFTNHELQQLYAQLVELGSESLIDALIVGATIEDLDIKDLMEASIEIDNQDILLVYDNLTKGSRNHLRSFYRNIKNQGAIYEAQFISDELFQEIINSDLEQGNRKGKGRRGNKSQRNQTCDNTLSAKQIKAVTFPNPANPTMTIQYELPAAGNTHISIYNTIGQLVADYAVGYQESGQYTFTWDALDHYGNPVTSGLYFYRIRANNLIATNKFSLMR